MIFLDIPSTKHINVVSKMDCGPSEMVIEPIKQGGVVPQTESLHQHISGFAEVTNILGFDQQQGWNEVYQEWDMNDPEI